MGAICCGASEESTVLVDLPPRRCITGDAVEAWELTLPFSQCSFAAFAHNLKLAHKKSGECEDVTIQALGSEFNTKAWKDLRNPNSKLC